MIKQHMQLVNIIIFLASTGISFRKVVCLFMGQHLSASVSEIYVKSENETSFQQEVLFKILP